ncbi:Uncharacterised protein [Salmonella enterica]|nr:Uncharacterised protein [Salmonella enterica]
MILADVQSSYGLDRPFQGAGNFETEHQRTLIREVCAAVQTGRLSLSPAWWVREKRTFCAASKPN